MILTSPLALIALAGAATPVLIYLLLRRRKRELDWGASYLLRLTLQSRRKTSRWKQFVVLAVRAMIIALAVLLLAGLLRPNPAPTNAVPALPDKPVHRVVLLDNSLSMSVADGLSARFTHARRALAQLCAGQRIGDRLTVLPLVRGEKMAKQISFSGPLPRELSPAFAAFAPTEGRVALSPSLAAAFPALARTPEAQAEIYVLSDCPRELREDLQYLDWVPDALQQRAARLVMVNFAPEQDTLPNVVVRDIQVGSDFVLAGVPFAVYVDAVNYSDTETTANFDIVLSGETRAQRAMAFKANESRRFPLWMTLDQPGTVLLTVQTDQSRLELHGRRSLSLSVRDQMKVWVVAEDRSPASGEATEETEFLLRALAGRPGASNSIRAEKAAVSALTRAIPEDIDLVILAAPRFAVPAAAPVLEAFVRRGGGLILTMGPAMKHDGYNEKYSALLPAPLAGPARANAAPDQFSLVRREPTRGASPLFAELATDIGGDLGRVRVYNYMRFAEDKLSGNVPFRLANDAPLVLQRSLGRGRVFVFASSLGISWNSMPVRQSFIPFWVRLAHAAMAGRAPARNLSAGEKLILPWPTAGVLELTQPDQSRVELAAAAWQEQAFVQLEAPRRGGVYTLTGATKGGQQLTEYFTVRGTAGEGDLRSLDASGRAELATALGVPVFSSWPQAVEELGAADANSEMWPWILLIMLGLYAFEAWFVRKL